MTETEACFVVLAGFALLLTWAEGKRVDRRSGRRLR